MELLFLCHRIPYPPNKGDKIRSYHLLKYLVSQGWRVHLGTFADTEDDMLHRETLGQQCASIAVESLPRWRKLSCPLGVLKGTSLSVECFRNRRLQQYVDGVLATGAITAALVVSAPMAEYLRAAAAPMPPVRILDLVDVDSEKWRGYAARSPWPKNWIYGLEASLHGRYEQRAADLFRAVLLASEAEAELFRSLGGGHGNVLGISNGVDMAYFAPQGDDASPEAGSLVFCGAMDYPPNVDAVVWFSDTVLPAIRQRLPETTFWIVGARPTRQVRALATRAGVRVTGAVTDVRPFVAGAALSVAPIRVARGLQNKVLEAMAMGKAVVATPQAFEGIEAVPGRDLAVAADEPTAFAEAVLDLLLSPQAATAMGMRARACVEQRYSWAARLAPLEALLR